MARDQWTRKPDLARLARGVRAVGDRLGGAASGAAATSRAT
jgi:hypothetical protein